MSRAAVDAINYQDSISSPLATNDGYFDQSLVMQPHPLRSSPAAPEVRGGPRRTPRKSLIVVLPENHVVSPDLVTNRLAAEGNDEIIDVILACAGQPHSITALQRRVRDLQVLLAPAGTSTEDLREFAMSQAPGDIVTLLSGTPV